MLTKKTIKKFFFLIGGCFLMFPSLIFAATATNEGVAAASEVLIVYNTSYTTDSNSNSTQDSLEVAQYYQTKRSIPAVNLVGLAMETTEVITRAQYESEIKSPLETYLTAQGLADTIKYIVLVKGVPLKISATNGTAYGVTDYSSVDAAVCLLYQTYDIAWRVSNPYFNVDSSYSKAYRFDTNHFLTGTVTLKYLVTRLDGYTVADIEGMIDRAYAADTTGSKYWIIDDHLKDYDSMLTANTKMTGYGFNVTPSPYTDTTDFITSASGNVIGYTSHGIHAGMPDGYYSSTLSGLTYADGAVTSTYESYNGYGFVSASQSTHGQVAEFVAEGGSGGIGNVYEPWASTIADESIWMPAYAMGYTWADAAYMSLPYLDFVSVVVGDPLMIVSDIVPPSDITDMTAVGGDGQVSLTWANPSSDYLGTKILRKAGSYPTNSSDGTVVYNSTGESYVDTNVVNGTTYYYVAFAYDAFRNYSAVTVGAQATAAPSTDTVPPSSVTALQATPGYQQVSLTWTNPDDSDFVGTKIVRKTGSYPTSHTDGTEVCSSSGTSCMASGLTNSTPYFFAAFAYDGVPNYSTLVAGSQATATPVAPVGWESINDFSAPGSVTSLTATPGAGQVVLTWTNATDDDLRGVRIMRRTDYYPTSPTDGVLVWQGSGISYTDIGVVNSTTYFYTIFSYDGVPNFSSVVAGAKTLATPCSGSCSNSSPGTAPINAPSEPDNTPPLTATDMVAVAGDGQVSLTWTNPFNDLDWYGTVIVRKLGSYPASYSDGILVYSGTGSSYTDTGVNNGTTYYYMAFTYDEVPNFSSASDEAKDSATPSS